MLISQLQLVIGSAGLVNGLAIAVFLFFTPRGNTRANRILALLILAVMAKITFAYTRSEFDITSDFIHRFKLIGMAGYFAISPLMWLYIKTVTHKQHALKYYDYLHLLPTAYILLIPIFKLPDFILSARIGLAQIIIYLAISISYLYSQKRKGVYNGRQSEYKLLRNILIGIGILWIDIFLLLSQKFAVFYLLELCVLFTLILYFIAYSEFRQVWIKKTIIEVSHRKYSNSKLDYIEARIILSKLQKLMDAKRPYERHDITLPKLAKMLKVSPHQLSEVINSKTNMNFAEYINNYRIEKAKELLLDPSYAKLKIAVIANECGFNTLSTFNLSFKRATHTTPSKYRDDLLFQQAM